jgi:SAM-dependent methyltransferase
MSTNRWQSDFYDAKLDFVSQLGKGVVDLLDPKPGETVLDLGCGTGDLAHEIAGRGATVLGMDISPGMIEAARKKYPGLHFFVGDGERFSLEHQVDAVFSNAALHWMTKPDRVAACVWDALKPGGRFVAELGGQGNVETVIRGIVRVLERDFGIDAEKRHPWYFPSIGQYSTLLEQQGFRVTYAAHFDRPTIMKDGENGLRLWLDGFAEPFFAGLAPAEREAAVRGIEDEVRDALFRDGAWHIDYKRLRVAAVKPQE